MEQGIKEGEQKIMNNIFIQLRDTGQLKMQTDNGVIILMPKQSE